MTPLQIVQLINALMGLAREAGVNLRELNEMFAQSADGKLTDEQLQQLSDNAQAAIDRL